MNNQSKPFGLLRICMDRRFHAKTCRAFEELTRLNPEDFWLQADAGGAAGDLCSQLGLKFAIENGAKIVGLSAHGEECGGLPGLNNRQIQSLLKRNAAAFAKQYHATLYTFFATSNGIIVTKIQ